MKLRTASSPTFLAMIQRGGLAVLASIQLSTLTLSARSYCQGCCCYCARRSCSAMRSRYQLIFGRFVGRDGTWCLLLPPDKGAFGEPPLFASKSRTWWTSAERHHS